MSTELISNENSYQENKIPIKSVVQSLEEQKKDTKDETKIGASQYDNTVFTLQELHSRSSSKAATTY